MHLPACLHTPAEADELVLPGWPRLCPVCCAVVYPLSSPRRVSPEDIQQCEDKFSKSKLVHSIMRHVAETTGEAVEVRGIQQWGADAAVRTKADGQAGTHLRVS